ncbi:Dolichyl-phosphate-mannose--protein mannosyltransferase 2 [Colletotrichum sp. SAR11_239]|nr:Dolichyl-phosphate-mannose--protein mannosyltransferase 2 [Colletotrichum sp. SAR11_239]
MDNFNSLNFLNEICAIEALNVALSYLQENEDYDTEPPIHFIGDGSPIRLILAQSGRKLNSHEIAAPITKVDKEVLSQGHIANQSPGS